MTKLHFNYKDLFRSLRLGLSAKKIWVMFIGLVVGLGLYAGFAYLAWLVAGHDLLTVWENFRLLPFAEPALYPFPWYSWATYGIGVLLFAATALLAGTAVSKITYEQLRGDEFYESREAWRFAFRHAPSVLASPLLVLGFVALIVVAGLLLSLLGAVPFFGEIFVGLMALPAVAASLFTVYLLIILLCSLLLAPAVVGASRSDTFDTLFEVFSCANEQPGRLAWYLGTVAVLSQLGSFLLGLAMSAAGRIGHLVLRTFMGQNVTDLLANGAFYIKVTLPDWWPGPLYWLFRASSRAWGTPELYLPGEYVAGLGWAHDTGAVLVAIALYVVALVVAAYGCSIWYSGTTLAYTVLAQKKDDKNLLELPDEGEDLLAPVVNPSEAAPPPNTDEGK